MYNLIKTIFVADLSYTECRIESEADERELIRLAKRGDSSATERLLLAYAVFTVTQNGTVTAVTVANDAPQCVEQPLNFLKAVTVDAEKDIVTLLERHPRHRVRRHQDR